MKLDVKQLVALILAVTVCACILVPVVVAMFYVGKVSETFTSKIFDLITFLAGIVSGWLLNSKGDGPPKV